MRALLVALLAALLCVACSGAQVGKDLSCSPNADIAYAQALAATCQGKPLAECPEADALGDSYEESAGVECSKQ